MKIIAVLENDVSGGGGLHQALNATLQMRDLCRDRFDFEVLTSVEANAAVLRKLGVPVETFTFSATDRLFSQLAASRWWHLAQMRLKLTAPFEKMLLQRGCDLAYFVAPSAKPNVLQRLNFIATVWDLCHRDALEFPEVRSFTQFQLREYIYRTSLPSAFTVVADSDALAVAIARRYGIDQERLLAMPFAPAPFLSTTASTEKTAVFAKYGLDEGYFFYPAQFWAHKNHVRILQALLLLRDRGERPRVAFAGGEQGNRAHLERFVDAHALREQVHFLGFVPTDDMRGLYEGCCAVVMPTYFGPTNMPPLEAWSIGKPLIYSSHLREQAGDAALCVDPDDADELAQAMHSCAAADTRARLASSGALRLRQVGQQRKDAEAVLLERLRRFEVRRSCWP